MNYASMDVGELAALFRDGDNEAGNEIVRRFRDSLFAFCVRVTGNAEEAADAVQETFLKLLSIRKKIDASRSLPAFLHRIAYNICMDGMRKRRHSFNVMDFSWAEKSFPPADEDVMAIERTHSLEEVWDAVDKLPLSARTLVELRYRSGLTPDEIAEVLGILPATVRVRLFRARKLLASMLRSHREGGK